MDKIEIESIGFKNFLCFGSKWQEIKFNNGINFISGYNKDTGRSNGSGKSSLLEVILFTLFGKVSKNIKQDQIVNWKNKKNLETFINFKLKNNSYKVIRTLKPNKLEIYKNGTLIDQDANKTDYQNMFEEIFGMDDKMFMSLIHSNINSSSNILSMKKNEKRLFLERMFGLQIYSDMNKICNDKLRDVSQKKYKVEINKQSFNDKIESSKNMISKFELEIKNKKDSIGNLEDIKKQLNELKENNINIDKEIENIKKETKEKEDNFNKINLDCEKKITLFDSKIEQLNKEIKDIENQEEQRKKNEEVEEKIKQIEENNGNIDEINKKINKNEKILLDEKNKLNTTDKKIIEIEKNIVELKTTFKGIEKSVYLLKDGKCPTCGNEGDNLSKLVFEYEKEMENINDKIYKQGVVKESNLKKKEKVEDDIEKIENSIKKYHNIKDELNNFKSQIKEVKSVKEKNSLIEEKESIELKTITLKDKFSKTKTKYNNEISDLKLKEGNLKQKQNNIKSKQNEYDIAVSNSKEIEKHINSLKDIIKEQKNNIKSVENDIGKLKEDESKFNTLSDYLDTIKFVLKDENIKQHTIRKIMPFINKQANYYLSEVDYGFYLDIDKWLDVEIKGPGIRNASYESLSSGEKKGVDLSIQLAMLDVAQTMSGFFPDLLVFDELLDSSIDSIGMNKLMDIIKFKQKKIGGKVFIISHRSEIDQEFIDNEIKVVKSNGFSEILT